MATNSAIERQIKNQLERLRYRLLWANTARKSEKEEKAAYKIEYCHATDNEWHIAKKLDNNIEDFISSAKSVIKLFVADAMRITLYQAGKPFDTEIVKITDANIPLLEQTSTSNATASYGRDIAPYFEKLTQTIQQSTGLSGANDLILQGIQRESETQISIMQLKHEHALERLQDKINNLTEKLDEREERVAELEDEIAELEELAKSQQQEVTKNKSLLGMGRQGDVLIAAGLGKLFKMKNEEIIGLAGLLSGGEITTMPNMGENEEDKNSNEELLSQEQSSNAAQNDKRKDDLDIIIQWLNEVDDDSFQYICYILRTLAARPDLYRDTLMLLEEKSNENGESKVSEKKPSKDTTTKAIEPNEENTDNTITENEQID